MISVFYCVLLAVVSWCAGFLFGRGCPEAEGPGHVDKRPAPGYPSPNRPAWQICGLCAYCRANCGKSLDFLSVLDGPCDAWEPVGRPVTGGPVAARARAEPGYLHGCWFCKHLLWRCVKHSIYLQDTGSACDLFLLRPGLNWGPTGTPTHIEGGAEKGDLSHEDCETGKETTEEAPPPEGLPTTDARSIQTPHDPAIVESGIRNATSDLGGSA